MILTFYSASSQRSSMLWVWFYFLSILGAIAAYYKIFMGFSVWDDEGSLMITAKQYLSGAKLYD